MVKVFSSGSLEHLADKSIAVIGYGNVGRSLALNFRDSGLNVVVGDLLGNEYSKRAKADGFEPRPIPEAAELGDVVVLALPDDVTPEVFKAEVVPGLHAGKTLILTSGMPTAYGLIPVPGDVDTALFVPKVPGVVIRDRYLEGRGYAAVVGVVQDASGNALNTALAIAAAAGTFRQGGFALEASAEQEALADLIGEQVLKSALLAAMEVAFTAMTKAGVPPELAALELYASGELGELARLMALMGPYGALKLQSPVDAYGQLTRLREYVRAMEPIAESIVDELRTGEFIRDLYLERATGYIKLNSMWRASVTGELARADSRLRSLHQSSVGPPRV